MLAGLLGLLDPRRLLLMLLDLLLRHCLLPPLPSLPSRLGLRCFLWARLRLLLSGLLGLRGVLLPLRLLGVLLRLVRVLLRPLVRLLFATIALPESRHHCCEKQKGTGGARYSDNFHVYGPCHCHSGTRTARRADPPHS